MIARSVMAGGDSSSLLRQDLQSEIAYRLDGPVGLRAKVETTKERMRLGAITGVVLDADGSTLYDCSALFGVSLPAEIDFALGAATPAQGVLQPPLRERLPVKPWGTNLPHVTALAEQLLTKHPRFGVGGRNPKVEATAIMKQGGPLCSLHLKSCQLARDRHCDPHYLPHLGGDWEQRL